MGQFDDMVDATRKLLIGSRFDGLNVAEIVQAKYILRAMFHQLGFATGELLDTHGIVSEKAIAAALSVLSASVTGVASAMNAASAKFENPGSVTIADAAEHVVTHIRRRGLHVVRNDEPASEKPKKPRRPRKPKSDSP